MGVLCFTTIDHLLSYEAHSCKGPLRLPRARKQLRKEERVVGTLGFAWPPLSACPNGSIQRELENEKWLVAQHISVR